MDAPGKKLGYLTAGVGAVLALIAFGFFSYLESCSGIGSFCIVRSPIDAPGIAGSDPFFWLEVVFPVIVIFIAAFHIFRREPFANPREFVSLLVLGILGWLMHVLLVALYINASISGGCFLICSQFSYDFGYWFYVVGVSVIIMGAILARPRRRFVEEY